MLEPDLQRLATHYANSQGMGNDDSVVRALVSQISSNPQLLEQVMVSERNAAADRDLVNSDYAQHKSIGVSAPPNIQDLLGLQSNGGGQVSSGSPSIPTSTPVPPSTQLQGQQSIPQSQSVSPPTTDTPTAVPGSTSNTQVQAATPPVSVAEIMASQVPIPDVQQYNAPSTDNGLVPTLMGAAAAGGAASMLGGRSQSPSFDVKPVSLVDLLSGPPGSSPLQLTGQTLPNDLSIVMDPEINKPVGVVSESTKQAFHYDPITDTIGPEVTDGLTKRAWFTQFFEALKAGAQGMRHLR